ncbi:MAG: UDP-N-acetylenolpyruvoylglucosamine reductase [Gammaproteobacteria bacterium]|nr:UDP-N-acetylenolpyruvoylglucosamine reductase [Gammaproteobacteria bacterium]
MAAHRPVDFEPRGKLLYGEPMCRHTSWRVGGPADLYFAPADLQDLLDFLRFRQQKDWPVTWFGLGSNTLVRDGGIRGIVVATHKSLGEIELRDERTVHAQVGVPCAKIARLTARNGLADAEFFAGIPGTLGGALAMNAGAHGRTTWEVVHDVETVDPGGLIHRRRAVEFEIGYRSVRSPREEWFVSAVLALKAGDPVQSRERIREFLESRARSQPIRIPNAGSVFINPPNDHAARLIETAGLKGVCVGGACVSEKHANFIVNHGTASATDIETLIEQVVGKVKQVHGIVLQPEVRIVGERP